ncbi:transporter [Pedobacter sp. BMA]|nr:transporter [Pedobacter sp. BMA]
MISIICWSLFFTDGTQAQTLSMKSAIQTGTANYGMVKAKAKYAEAAQITIAQIRREFFPNLNLSAQQDYGTVNGQNGPLYGLGGLGVASSGLPLAQQNWNSAFGALYLVNTNWDVFTFGRNRQRINVAQADAKRLEEDYQQELFQHKVRIAGAYLNLLASQRLLRSQEKNLQRTMIFLKSAAARVKSGLLPGVDSTVAAAEVSRAKITLNQTKEQVKIQNNELTQLMGGPPSEIITDTTLVTRIPASLATLNSTSESINHPTRQFFQSRISLSEQQERFFKKEFMPTINLFGVLQSRGSGFSADYASNQSAYTRNYLDGIRPMRQNYLLGAGLVWNLTSILRSSKKAESQRLITQGLKDEYQMVNNELRNRDDAATARLDFALQNYNQAPLQVRAAQQAYRQRQTLYNNGLSILTDLTTALFTLNRAETDRDIAFTNVWQALLMKAASTGDFDLFNNEL